MLQQVNNVSFVAFIIVNFMVLHNIAAENKYALRCCWDIYIYMYVVAAGFLYLQALYVLCSIYIYIYEIIAG